MVDTCGLTLDRWRRRWEARLGNGADGEAPGAILAESARFSVVRVCNLVTLWAHGAGTPRLLHVSCRWEWPGSSAAVLVRLERLHLEETAQEALSMCRDARHVLRGRARLARKFSEPAAVGGGHGC